MDQLTWLQQSLQKPRLSAVARVLAEVFPRMNVPRILIGADDVSRGTYNSASKLAPDHIEYPGFILRYRELNSGGNYINHGWARTHTDHIGVLGGQVTVANDGFMSGAYIHDSQWMAVRSTLPSGYSAWRAYKQDIGIFTDEFPVGFASLVPSHPGLLSDESAPAITDSAGTILLTDSLSFDEPISRGFTSIQWLTESETRRSK